MSNSYKLIISSFLEYLQLEKRYSVNTLLSYRNDLQQFFGYLDANYQSPELALISIIEVRSWLAALKNDKISAKSIRRKISALQSLYKYLLQQNIVEKSPVTAINLPKTNKRLPVFIEENQTENLFRDINFDDTWKGRTERLLLEVFYTTGIRVSELINLKEADLDIWNQYVKVLGKGNKQRIIPLSKGMVQSLEAYINEKSQQYAGINNIFITEKGKALYPRMVYNIVNRHLGKVTTLQKKSPHVLRHTFATHLSNNGAELNAIKELLGHSSLAATQIYTHTTIEKLKEVFKKAHPKA